MSFQGDPPRLALIDGLLGHVARACHVPPQDREDFCQDLRLLWIRDSEGILAHVRKPDRLQAYVFKTLCRRGSNWCRTHTWREAAHEASLMDTATEPADNDNPEIQFLRHEDGCDRQCALERALALLEPGARCIIELRFSVGLSVAEIARQLSLTPPVVSARLWRAIQTMRRACAEQETEESGRERERERERERSTAAAAAARSEGPQAGSVNDIE